MYKYLDNLERIERIDSEKIKSQQKKSRLESLAQKKELKEKSPSSSPSANLLLGMSYSPILIDNPFYQRVIKINEQINYSITWARKSEFPHDNELFEINLNDLSTRRVGIYKGFYPEFR